MEADSPDFPIAICPQSFLNTLHLPANTLLHLNPLADITGHQSEATLTRHEQVTGRKREESQHVVARLLEGSKAPP